MTTKRASPSAQGDPLAGLLRGNRRHLLVLFGLSIVANLLMLVGPLFMLQVYDRVLGSRSVPTLAALTLLVVALFAFYAFVELIRSRMAIRLGRLTHDALAADTFDAAVRAPLNHNRPAGDPVRDLDLLRGFISGPGPISLMDLPWLPLYMGLIFCLHPLLGWVAVAGAVVMLGLLLGNEALSRRSSRAASAAVVQRQHQLDDARTNAEVIVAMGMTGPVADRWLAAEQHYVDLQQRASDQAAFFASAGRGFRMLLQSASLAAGAYLVIIGQFSPGLMLAASVITSRALAPIEQVVAHWKGFVAARQALGRLHERLAQAPMAAPRTSLPLPRSSLDVRNLSSGPGADGRPLINDVSFSLKAGEVLGIIGPSGSGKSSVVRALTGVWPVLRGDIRLDQSALTHYDRDDLGRVTGYLPQDVELFDGTVAENISRFRPHASSPAIMAAAALSGTHQLISRLSEGYDTRIGPRGASLSAGQRQRIGLARALFGDPFLLVLDEPNSNLDAEGEAALARAVQGAKARGAVVIIVAHRPTTLMAADRLLVIEAGRQVGYGPRDEVLRAVTPQNNLAGSEPRRANG